MSNYYLNTKITSKRHFCPFLEIIKNSQKKPILLYFMMDENLKIYDEIAKQKEQWRYPGAITGIYLSLAYHVLLLLSPFFFFLPIDGMSKKIYVPPPCINIEKEGYFLHFVLLTLKFLTN